jgi:alkylation response protein AidB-like acyl-CoA dehydrogenase
VDFADSPEEAAFRAEAYAFLTQHAKLKDTSADTGGGVLTDSPEDEPAHVKASQAWQATLFDNGWAGITWPVEAGGRGGTAMQSIIFNQEQAKFEVPGSVFAQGIGMAGPTIIQHGTAEQKARFLRPMLRGEEIWCQLFSEPGAGSDLASLATRAELDGDEYVVNGQKVWTSSAHYSDWGILLARTDFDAPKHRGISYFLVDMRTPGIEIRPLRQITGIAHFNEVFLTDVRIPVTMRVGKENDGWRVTTTTLSNERALIGGGGQGGDPVGELIRLARATGLGDDLIVRQQLVQAYTHHELQKYLGWRALSAVSRGAEPGPETSILKLVHSLNQAEIGELAMTVVQTAGTLLDYGHLDSSPWTTRFLSQWMSRIGGGTEDIQRNVISERVLGLPREPQVDKDRPFRESLRG